MGRALSVLFFVLLAGALFVLPQAEPARLAALEVPDLLDHEPEGDGATLADAILDGPAVARRETGELVLNLGGVRLVSSAWPSADLGVHGLARAALISGLRQHAAGRAEALEVDGELMPVRGGAQVLVLLDAEGYAIEFEAPGAERLTARIANWHPPRRTSLLPPLIAILLAILFRRPVLALFCGVWAGTLLMRLADGQGGLVALVGGLPDVATDLFWPQLVDPYRVQIMGFVIAMLAMVGVMTRSGGVRGMMDLVARLARSARRTQIATWMMGLVVFFDDYANCILVGTTMRPLADRFRISREKLAYLVDSTAAPVAGLSIFSTWIAFEVSTFSAQLPAAGMLPSDGYSVFVETLPFRFYCLLTLFLSAVIAFSGRDFGPMLQAERRARATGKLVRDGGKPMVRDEATHLEPQPGVEPDAFRALLPVLVFVGLTLFEILRVGLAALREADPDVGWTAALTLQGITDLLGNGDSTRALLVGSSSGLLVAVVLALRAGLRLAILHAAWTTLRAMGIAIAILYLAWMIGATCDRLGTAPYLTALLGDHLAPELLPAILFLTSAVVAFSTGSSWSTMSILLPLVVGMAFNLGKDSDLGGHLLMVMSIGAVLEGSIFGDHCSPISDTTVLSSTASASDHIDHVRTQVPYAVTSMLAALGLGYLPCAFAGHHPLISLLAAMGVVLMLVLVLGRKSEPAAAPARAVP